MGSGGSIFKEAERGVRDTASAWQKDPWGQLVRTATDLMSATTVKYDPNTGKVQEGSAIHRFDEIIGELSGRNKARIQNYAAEENLQKAQISQQRDTALQQLNQYRSDVLASQAAQATRKTAEAGNKVNQQYSSSSPLGTEQDFLGL